MPDRSDVQGGPDVHRVPVGCLEQPTGIRRQPHHRRHPAHADRRRREHRRGRKPLGGERDADRLAGRARRGGASAAGVAHGGVHRARQHRRRGSGRENRHEGAQIRLPSTDRGGECSAGCAVAQVRTDPPAAKNATVTLGDRLANLSAGHRASLGAFLEPAPSLEDRLLGGTRRGLECDSDLLVRQTAELSHHERAPGAVGQRGQVAEQDRQPRTLAGLILRRGRNRERRVGQ